MFLRNHNHAIVRVLLLAILLLGNLGIRPAQAETLDLGWAQRLGGTHLDYETDITVDDSGNVYTSGFNRDLDSGDHDAFIRKWNGNHIWLYGIAGLTDEIAHAVALDGEGNVYAAGTYSDTVDFDGAGSTSPLNSAGLTDIFILKLQEESLGFLWVKGVGGISTDSGHGLTVDGSGNVYLTGTYSDTVDFDPSGGMSTLSSAGDADVFILKLDSNGDFLWVKSVGGPGAENSFDIAVDESGNVFVTGSFTDTVDFDPDVAIINLTSSGESDLFIEKLDSEGNFAWAKTVGGTSFDSGIEVTLDGSGNVYTVGYFNETISAGVDTLTSAGSNDILISKWNNDGIFLWAKGMGSTEFDAGYGIDVDEQGNIYTTGEFYGTVDFDPGAGTGSVTSAGQGDIFISKLDSNGNFVWAKGMGGSSNDVGEGIVVRNGDLFLTGSFSDTVDFDLGQGTTTLTSYAELDAFVSKMSLTPQIHYVKWDASGANNGSSWTDAYTDLQSALAAASSGDEIWVAAGTYKPTSGTDREISFTLKNGVAVYGGFAGTETLLSQRNYETNVTVLSGDIGVAGDNSDNSYHVVVGSNTDNSAVLDGFTITSGNANGSDANPFGGGMYTFTGSPTIINITFTDNAAAMGGGMYNENKSNPRITHVVFHGNTATDFGGGMDNFNSNPILNNVTFIDNWAQNGGGMTNTYSKPTLTNVTFHKNGVTDVYGDGGGMDNFYSDPILNKVTFSENSPAFWGGGMNNAGSNPILTDVMFYKNAATSSGGGMSNYSSSPILTNVTFKNNSASYGGGIKNSYNSYPILTNVTLSANSASTSGGGISNETYSNPTLTNVTFSGNSATTVGGGIYNDFSGSNATIRNSILYGNFGGEIYNGRSTAVVSYSIVQGGYPGIGNIDADPVLEPLHDNGGFTQTMALGAGSPAIDAAEDASCPDTDQREITRPQGSHCDIGAYEFDGDATAPVVTSIVRANASPTNAASVNFTVTFSEPVSGVAASDFIPHPTGSVTGAIVQSVSGSGAVYTVTVNTGTGNGTLRLDMPASASITDMTGNSLAGLPFTSGQSYTIFKGATFSDVETDHWAWQYVERLVNAGITAGCGGGQYCPESTVTRAQMAVFLERGIHGSSYSPPAIGSSTGFTDVPLDHWAAAWIKQLAADGITSGCGGGKYCPEASVTRAQMAIFLLKAKHGASYSPPAVGGSTGFGDVQPTHWAAAWIKQLVAEGITAGCGNGNYCPESPVTRAQMAVFLVKTFNLP